MTVTILQPDEATSKDTYVDLLYLSAQNNGPSAELRLGYYDDMEEFPQQFNNYIYIQFDLTGLTEAVGSAILSLYRTYVGHNGQIGVKVKAVTGAWTESTITGSNKPTNEATSVGDHQLSPAGMGSINIWDDIDVTSIVNRIIQGTLVNNGFVITADVDMGAGIDGCYIYSSSSAANTTQRPKLTLTSAVEAPTISPIIISTTNVVAAFNFIPAPLDAPIIIIASASSMSAAFVAIPLAYINPAIISISQVVVALEALAIMDLNASFVSISVTHCTLKLVIPEFLILRGNVSIAGTPVTDAFIRAIADDGSKVYLSTSDTFGDYELAVDSSGLYHVICYKRDVDGSIFSSVSHPFIEVVSE